MRSVGMSIENTVQINLKNGQTLRLESVVDKNTDLSQDQALGVNVFVNAFKDSHDAEIKEHFQSAEKIADYYHHLIQDYDIGPFREGKLIWIRAFLENKFIGWMGLEPNFRNKNHTYISTFVLDPQVEGKGIGEKMLSSITQHWLPETTELNLLVRKINHKALGFFQRFGFSSADDIDHPYNDNPLHCQFMRCKPLIGQSIE